MSDILIINSKDDLIKHFEGHEKIKEDLWKKRMNATDEEILTDNYKKIVDDYDYYNVGYGEWGLSYGKIEMYWSHEGDVLTNVHYCPFCGIKFEVKQQGR